MSLVLLQPQIPGDRREVGWDLGPLAAGLAPGQTSPPEQNTKEL